MVLLFNAYFFCDQALERDSELLSLLVRDGVFVGPSEAQAPEVTSTAAVVTSHESSQRIGSQAILTAARAKAVGSTLATNLAACDFEWYLITPGWFLTLYADSLPPTALLQLWDLVLWHGGNTDLRSSISNSSIQSSRSGSVGVESNVPALPPPPPAPARAVLLWAALKAVAARADTLSGDSSGGRSGTGKKEPLSLTSTIEQLKAGAWASGLPSETDSEGKPLLCPPPTLEAVHAAVARLAPQANAILVEARAKRAAIAAQRLARKTAATANANAATDNDTTIDSTNAPSENASSEGNLDGKDVKSSTVQRRRPRGRSPRRPATSPSPSPPPQDWRARVAKGMSFL